MSEDTREQRLHYGVRLLIKHPSIDPNVISDRLGLVPHLTWTAGGKRFTPTGGPLPGVHRESVWGWSERVEGRRDFFAQVTTMIERLEAHRSFLWEIVDTGGRIELIFDLAGHANIGDSLRWSDLKRLGELKVNLGVEVFPEFR